MWVCFQIFGISQKSEAVLRNLYYMKPLKISNVLRSLLPAPAFCLKLYWYINATKKKRLHKTASSFTFDHLNGKKFVRELKQLKNQPCRQ